MYFPFLRGKQFELLALREMAPELRNVTPLIEPVKENFSSLVKAVSLLNESSICPLVVMNPTVGFFKGKFLPDEKQWEEISELNFIPCFRISEGDSESLFNDRRHEFSGREYSLFFDRGITSNLIRYSKNSKYNVISHDTNPAALKQLKNVVLFGDFFKSEDRNADYKVESEFSYLHATFRDYANVSGFSDYGVLSSQYKEGGGPAYVVTIHMSYIDYDRFDQMFVRHYSSEDNGSPANPGGKFLEALAKFNLDAESRKFFLETKSLIELKQLHEKGHFPGLGYVKKLSIKHHVETIDNYLES